MKGFKFGLERLLWLRSQFERAQARALNDAQRQESERREALARAEKRLGEYGTQITQAAGETPNAGTLHVLGMSLQRAAREMEAAEDSHRESLEGVESAEERFRTSRSERRTIEKLREHRAAEWNQEATRIEQREMDGLGARRRDTGDDSR
ncbi:MAG: flagellar export protein FliJ [Candidatus Eiseniibacteriota bacterium]